MTFTKRQMLLVPEVNPESFVFFFESGNSGTSWSIRDYSVAHRIKTHRSGDFQQTADYFFQKARYAFNAPRHDTNDLAFWHKYTMDLNQKHGLAASIPISEQIAATSRSGNTHPILSLDELLGLPKGRKVQDMERILHSAQSEDWVTWNFFQIMFRECPACWWKRMLQAASRRNPELDLLTEDCGAPVASFWSLVRSPEKYQDESRKRMNASHNPLWVARAASADPVEGPSEIDIKIEHSNFLVFIEAKLGSDISPDVKYDPHRNQIVRNIDCLLDQAGQRTAAFWMLVKDEHPSRAYVQLMSAYKSDSNLLAHDLPHRNREDLKRICQNLTILRWSDFRELVCGADADPAVAAVKRELERRIADENYSNPPLAIIEQEAEEGEMKLDIEMNAAIPQSAAKGVYEEYRPLIDALNKQKETGDGWISIQKRQVPSVTDQAKQSLLFRIGRAYQVTIQTRTVEDKIYLRIKPILKIDTTVDTNVELNNDPEVRPVE